jgi:diguanylate cyclase (GGDEF)-like protein/PAS domain S-box-containing protein
MRSIATRAFSLQARLVAGLTLLFIAALTVLGVVLLDEARTRQARFELEQARYQAKTLADASADALIAEDFELMERWVRAALPSNNYAYAALVRPNGQVLTHTETTYIGRRLVAPPSPEAGESTQHYHNRPIREVRHPVTAGRSHLANAHVAYYLDTGEVLAPETLYKIAGLLVLLLGGLALGASFLSRKIIAPLRTLTAVVAQMSLDRPTSTGRVLTQRRDEVGTLAQSFDAMSQRLVQSFDELRHHRDNLEHTVDERTRELVEANHVLEEGRARIAAIMDNVADSIVTMDAEGRIESFNRAAERLFGYRAAEVVGRHVELLMPEEFRRDHQRHVQHYVETGNAVVIGRGARELSALRKDGAVLPIELEISALHLGGRRLFISAMRDITERKAMLDNLRHVADHDALTGLYNRRYFYAELERFLARAHRGNSPPCALMFIDLDKFKVINDTLGHAAGDRVLIEVADIFKARARKTDVLARLGGDEFAVLLYDAAGELAERAGESFRRQIENYRLEFDSVNADIGCSIGITMLDRQSGSLEDVLAQADHACYQAKRAGRNCVRRYDPADRDQSPAQAPETAGSGV